MTRHLYAALLFCASSSAFSQIAIESGNMPKAKDTFRFVVANPIGYSDQIALDGPNKTWVFNDTLSPATTLVEYKNSLATPYAFFFLNTVGLLYAENMGLGQFELEDVYQFYSNSSSSYRIEGMGLKISLAPTPLAGNYQVEDKVFQFPLEYGDRDSSIFRVKLQLPLLGTYSQSGHRITEVVGYGKVIIVDDTFDCLKVKATIVGADSVKSQFAEFGFPTKRIEYKWLTLDHRIPVAEITGTEVAGNFVPSLARHLAIEPDTATGGGGPGVGIEPNPAYFPLPYAYPNPARDKINFNDHVADYHIFNAQGKEIKALPGPGNTCYVGHFSRGSYFIRIRLTDGSERNMMLSLID